MCQFVSKEKFPIGTKTKVVAFIFLLSINSKRKRHINKAAHTVANQNHKSNMLQLLYNQWKEHHEVIAI